MNFKLNDMNEEDRGRAIGAIVLIALGVIFLLGSLGFSIAFNWWAIFIAIPGIAMLNNVWQSYRHRGTLEGNEFFQAGIGVFMLLLAASFLFDLDLDFLWRFWPVMLILLGLGMLTRATRPGPAKYNGSTDASYSMPEEFGEKPKHDDYDYDYDDTPMAEE